MADFFRLKQTRYTEWHFDQYFCYHGRAMVRKTGGDC
jgi:hypothetical protein